MQFVKWFAIASFGLLGKRVAQAVECKANLVLSGMAFVIADWPLHDPFLRRRQ